MRFTLHSTFFLTFILFITGNLFSQRGQINFYLDAQITSTMEAGEKVFSYEAWMYPVISESDPENAIEELNERLAFSYEALSEEEVEFQFNGVELDEPLDSRQILEMLAARMGIQEQDIPKSKYSVNTHISLVEWINDSAEYINVERTLVTKTKDQKIEQRSVYHCVMNALTADTLSLGDLGSKKIIGCAQKAIATSAFANEPCGDAKLRIAWDESLGCDTKVAMFRRKSIFLYPSKDLVGCDFPYHQKYLVEIPVQCFVMDKPCVK